MTVGKKTFSDAVKKLEENPGYRISKAEDSLFLRAFQLREAKTLTLKVEEVTPESEESIAVVPHVLGRADVHFNNHSFINSEEL